VLLKTIFDVAKFTTITSLSLLFSCNNYDLKIISFPDFALKTSNINFLMVLRKGIEYKLCNLL
jgi:hypothetical protein